MPVHDLIRSRLALLAAGALLTVAAGCGEPRVDAATPMRGGAPSLEELGRGVVEALVAADTAKLAGYRVTEREHTDLLWPEFPAAERADSTAAAFAWENIEMRNGGALYGLLGRYPESGMRYAGVACLDEMQEYRTFRVLDGCRVTLIDPENRRAVDQPFRSVVVRDGRYKLIRYYK